MAAKKRTEPTDGPQVSIQSLDSLALDPANERVHGDRNKQTVKNSLRRFGPGRSIVLDAKDVVVAGNCTVEQAKEEGFTEVIVVEPKPGQLVAVKRSNWSATESAGYRIADNRAAEHAEWDFQALAQNMKALQCDGLDLKDCGWEPFEVEPLLAAEWKPAAEGEMPGQPAPKEPHPHTVTFAPEAWAVIEQAVARIQIQEDDETITPQRALELIAADYLAGTPIPKIEDEGDE